jgi:phospholipase C
MKRLFGLGLFSGIFLTFSGVQAQDQNLQKINHVIVIYQENWSFDGLYGKFSPKDPQQSVEGFSSPDFNCEQMDSNGQPLTVLPEPDLAIGAPDGRIPANLPIKPYDLLPYLKSAGKATGDLVHRFYQEQAQIDGGKMDKFVAVSDNGGLVLSYFDGSQLPEGQLAQQYTLCDHYFHGAFGGSFLNHIYFIAADAPRWPKAPEKLKAETDRNGNMVRDGMITPDDYVVNTAQSVNIPHDPSTPADQLVPVQELPTIGDRLTDKQVTWAWYAEGFDEALAGRADKLYEYHHQPFIYFKKYSDPKDPSKVDRVHLKDKDDFLFDLIENNLPSVCWIKALGENDEHPGYSDIQEGQEYVANLVKAVQSSPYWKDTVILITYDENGGRWDHVAPPQRMVNGKKDWLGPGTRVPLIVISPFAKKGYVDSTVYDSTSILKFIESRWGLDPLNDRDKNAVNLTNAFDFSQN